MVNIRRLRFFCAAIVLAVLVAAAPVPTPEQSLEARARSSVSKAAPKVAPPKTKVTRPSKALPEKAPPAKPAATKATKVPPATTAPAKAAPAKVAKAPPPKANAAKATAAPAKAAPAKANTACPVPAKGSKAPRAPPALGNTASLTLGTVTRSLTRSGTQGANGDVFTVNAPGWPDPAAGNADVPAFAKTIGASAPALAQSQFPGEIRFTTAVGQTLASGKDCDDREWLVTRKAPGNPFKQTAAVIAAGRAGCKAELEKAIATTVAAIQSNVEQHGVKHTDPNPGNVFFNDDLTQATLIDWAGARSVANKVYTAVARAQDTAKVRVLFANQC